MIVANHQRYCQVVGATIGRFHARQFGLDRDTGPRAARPSPAAYPSGRGRAGRGRRRDRRPARDRRGDGPEHGRGLLPVAGPAPGLGHRRQYAFVAEFAGERTRVRTLAYWGKGQIRENIEFDLAGTPCEDVVRGGLCHHPYGVRERFPRDQALVDMGIESYLGVPLLDGEGSVLGHLAVFDERPMPAEPRRLFIFRIFATRAAVELETAAGRAAAPRERAALSRPLRGGAQRLRGPRQRPAVHQRQPPRNAVARLLRGGAGRVRPSRLFAETPPGRARAEQALRACLAGEEVSGLELEMRRRDGRPLWISLWMRPMRGTDGRISAAHSIWVDITDRVLAEAERARLQQQNLYLQEEIKSVHNFEEIVGRSPALLAVLDKVAALPPPTPPCSSPARPAPARS